MSKSATAYFDRSWNAWAVSYYDSSRGGAGDSYTTHKSEAEAHRVADAFNAREKRYAAQRKAADLKAQKPRRDARARTKSRRGARARTKSRRDPLSYTVLVTPSGETIAYR